MYAQPGRILGWVNFLENIMNYYQELLESYSKIKKRSFRILEQEKAKAKKPEAKKPGEDRPDALPTAKDYVGVAVGTHGYKHPQAVKDDGAALVTDMVDLESIVVFTPDADAVDVEVFIASA